MTSPGSKRGPLSREIQGVLPLSLALSQAGFGAYVAPEGRKAQRAIARGAGGFGGAALSVGLSEAITSALGSTPRTRLLSALLAGYSGGMLGATTADEAVRKKLNARKREEDERYANPQADTLRYLFESDAPAPGTPELRAI